MTDNRKSWTIEVNFVPISVRPSHPIDCRVNWNEKLALSQSVNERKISVISQIWKAMQGKVYFDAILDGITTSIQNLTNSLGHKANNICFFRRIEKMATDGFKFQNYLEGGI